MARRLKKYVIPTTLGLVGTTMVVSASVMLMAKKPVDSNYRYTVSEIKEQVYPVINEVEDKKPMKPFLEESVSKEKDYYRKDDDVNTQNNSLMYYEKTYMPSTGILYSSNEGFDVVASIDGTINKIGQDNILGNYVIIEHSNGYKTTYYSLGEIAVKEKDMVVKGDVIGISGTNKLESTENKYNVLFETYHDGYLMDPEDFYNISFEG